MQNGGCSHDCENIPGSYECVCPDAELSLAEDNHTCEGNTGHSGHCMDNVKCQQLVAHTIVVTCFLKENF